MSGNQIVVIDDHLCICQALLLYLHHEQICKIVGHALSIDEGQRICQNLRPDLIILDLVIPGGDALKFLKEIQETSTTRVLIFSGTVKEAVVLAALDRRPSGFVHKSASLEVLAQAIQTILEERRVFYCEWTSRFMARLHLGGKLLPELTQRESEILKMIVTGMASKMIASQLPISRRTVDSFRATIMQKMRVPDIATLCCVAVSQGLVEESRVFEGR